jgi:hypothetical protein
MAKHATVDPRLLVVLEQVSKRLHDAIRSVEALRIDLFDLNCATGGLKGIGSMLDEWIRVVRGSPAEGSGKPPAEGGEGRGAE